MSQQESFRDYLQARGRSEITINNYAIQIQNYLDGIGDADPFQAETVEGYLTKLALPHSTKLRGAHLTKQKEKPGLKAQSLRWTAYALRTYFRANHAPWNVELDRDKFSKASKPNTPIIWVDKINELLTACAKFKSEEDNEYDRSLFYTCIVYLSASLGLRRIELRNLTVEDFQLFKSESAIRVKTGKGGRVVVRELPEEAVKVIQKYLDTVRIPAGARGSSPLLARGYTDTPLSLRGLTYIFHRIAQEAGVQGEGVGYHSRRRGLVSEMAENGASDKTITVEMGWSSDSTVLRYQHLSSKFVKSEIRKANPMLMRGIQVDEPREQASPQPTREPITTRNGLGEPPNWRLPNQRLPPQPTLYSFPPEPKKVEEPEKVAPADTKPLTQDSAPATTTPPKPVPTTPQSPDPTPATTKPKNIMERYREQQIVAERMKDTLKAMTLSQRLEFWTNWAEKAKRAEG